MDIYIDFITESLTANESRLETIWNYLLSTGVIAEYLTANETVPTPDRRNIFLTTGAMTETLTANEVRWAIQAYIVNKLDTFTSGGDTTAVTPLLDILVQSMSDTFTANETVTTPTFYPTEAWLAPTFTDTLTLSEAETVNFYQFVIQVLTQLADSWSKILECYIQTITWEADANGNVPSFVIGGTEKGGVLNTWWLKTVDVIPGVIQPTNGYAMTITRNIGGTAVDILGNRGGSLSNNTPTSFEAYPTTGGNYSMVTDPLSVNVTGNVKSGAQVTLVLHFVK